MSGAVNRLRMEIDIWQAAWKQLEAFLDRVDETRSQDEPHALAVCALLPVMSVVEKARQRTAGVALSPALPCAPGGAGLAPVTPAVLTGTGNRLPGVEELEFAVGTIRVNDDGELEDDALLATTETLFAFRDEKHGGEVPVKVPSYDFGPLASGGVITGVVEGGLFNEDLRKKAIEEGTAELTRWHVLRDQRRDALEQEESESSQALSAVLNPLSIASGVSALSAVGSSAAGSANECRADAKTLETAKATLDEQGVASDASEAIGAALATLNAQASDYDFVATELTAPKVNSLTSAQLNTVKSRLHRADNPDGAGPLPLSILALDAAATTSMDEEVDARTTYPDGSLRMLRTLEWSLRFQWAFRRVWMEKRNRMFLKPLLVKVLGLFCESLRRLVAGSITGIPLVGVVLAKQATTQATELSVSPSADLKNIQAGHLAVVHGDRPTVALVLGQGTRGLENLLAISPLNVSVEADARLPGISGLVAPGTVVNAGPVSITSEELILGRAAAGAHADGRVQEVVALSSKLSLVLGKAGSALGLTPPSVAAPYESASAWALNAPVDAAATRLFLQQVPSASGSGTGGRIPVARPGELMLIRGADEEGRWWQGVVTVDRVDILKGAEARSEDEVTGTATPPCCGDDDEVMVVTLRSIQLPKGLVREATLRRDFAGFGGPSLATGVVLPKELDTGTASLEVVDNGVTKVVLRDAELRAAHALLKSWTGMRL